ncbi:MAG: DUF2726 domain-containing protein [Bacilli bacterium]|nr:DUF2726 domain-containing protein [Bacilli bacterium]
MKFIILTIFLIGIILLIAYLKIFIEALIITIKDMYRVIKEIFLDIKNTILKIVKKENEHIINKKAEYELLKKEDENTIYKTKDLITEYEEYFYKILLELEEELNVRIQSQINLASIINKTKFNKHIYELFRNIDFGIFTKDCKKILLLIEINDKSHNKPERIKRDKQVKDILKQSNIKLITFYSYMPHEKEYVKNKIKLELEEFKKY